MFAFLLLLLPCFIHCVCFLIRTQVSSLLNKFITTSQFAPSPIRISWRPLIRVSREEEEKAEIEDMKNVFGVVVVSFFCSIALTLLLGFFEGFHPPANASINRIPLDNNNKRESMMMFVIPIPSHYVFKLQPANNNDADDLRVVICVFRQLRLLRSKNTVSVMKFQLFYQR